ncbi:MAG: SDR family oxidoreductase [Pyrinomonadaceae bacterium]|nr:SDR family oxidoreductase [Pyrinomonadaceae bacterium]
MGEFEGKVALVTGGTSGIGEATVKSFAREGAKVAFTGRRAAEGNSISAAVSEEGGDAYFIEADIRNPEHVERMVNKTVEMYGRLDFAINNAGVEQFFKPLVDQTLEDFDFIVETNLRGVWLSMKAEIPAILESGGGAIVNTSSIFGVVAAAMNPLYVATKHAVIGLTKSAALEFAQKGIRVNAVLPAAIETPMIDRFAKDEETEKFLTSLHPIGRMGKPEEVAETVLWLCSERSSFVTGTSVRVDGGYTAQ